MAESLTIQQQAVFVDDVIRRCTSTNGRVAAAATLWLDVLDIETLQALADRLHRMAPYEEKIRMVVTGK